jgi:hypothetical protein
MHDKERHHRIHPAACSYRRASRFVSGDQLTGTHRDPQSQRYEIRIRGRLGETIRSAFPALRAQALVDSTVLTGILADQAAVYGVLAAAEALGLELIGFRRLPLDGEGERGASLASERPALRVPGADLEELRSRLRGTRWSRPWPSGTASLRPQVPT